MSKKIKNIITTVILMMALIQGPYLYYFTEGFIKIFIVIPFGLIGLGLTVLLFIKLVKYRSTNSLYHKIGLAVAFSIGLCTIRGDLMEYMDFHLRKAERNQIVDQVKKGILKSDQLPDSSFFPISKGGSINIKHNANGIVSIEFYIDRGFIDHYSAFLYTNDKKEIEGLDRAIAKANDRLWKKFDSNWYRVGY